MRMTRSATGRRAVAAPAAWLVGVVAPLLLAASVHGQTLSGWPIEAPPEPLEPTEVQFPPYEVRMLDNGMRVIAVLHHEQPVVSVRLLVGAGMVHEPPEKAGLANLLGALLDQGTAARSAQEIAETIDMIGGGLGVGAGSDLTFVNAVVMSDSFELVMGLLSEVIRQPAFAPEEIERQRQQMLSGLQVSMQDPDYVAGVVFERLVYGDHPYGRPQSGTLESLPTITSADLRAFHDLYFAPNNAIMAIVGDLTAETAFETAERIFGDWAPKLIEPPAFSAPPPPASRVVVVDMPGAVQTEIRAGHIGVARTHADYMPLDMAVRVLGGEGSNRLHRVLRTERGLTYGAEASIHTLQTTGDVVAQTDTRTEATAEALRLTIEEFWRLRRQPVGLRELDGVQAYMTGSFPLQLETPDAIALRVLNVLFYGLDPAELGTYRERVSAVSADDIQRVSQEFLLPDQLSIVLVGDASAFIDDLPAAGFANVERVSLADLDLSPGGLRVVESAPADVAAPARPTAAERAQAMEVVRRAIAAKGGADRLRTITTATARGRTTMYTPAGSMDADTVSYTAYPGRFRVEAALPTGRIVQAFADDEAWLEGPDGVEDASPTVRDDFRASLRRDLIQLLLRAADGGVDMRPIGAASADGRAAAVEFLTADIDEPVRLFLDPRTGLVIRQTYVSQGPAGPEETEELYSDYREVDGVQVAFRAIVRRGGVSVLERELADLTFNATIDAALFARPGAPE
ncbi:MAG: pitrilysin family protein [Vicinamibacterales bacterium]|nr:pitrilysin family protein [Vicinamibacterales bacterium]MDP6607483.1 pitrilysin family protein [Vicinamibacterales bacterium]HAK55397.1 hypothetical protein [Acidobacteriota bacterium]